MKVIVFQPFTPFSTSDFTKYTHLLLFMSYLQIAWKYGIIALTCLTYALYLHVNLNVIFFFNSFHISPDPLYESIV